MRVDVGQQDVMQDWFEWYCAQHFRSKQWAQYRDRFLCPCCYMPTLRERACFDICPVCIWEDDGQDSDDAAVVRCGPNGDYSLEEARRNFAAIRTMYRPSSHAVVCEEPERRAMRSALYDAFTQAIQSGSESDWIRAQKALQERG